MYIYLTVCGGLFYLTTASQLERDLAVDRFFYMSMIDLQNNLCLFKFFLPLSCFCVVFLLAHQ